MSSKIFRRKLKQTSPGWNTDRACMQCLGLGACKLTKRHNSTRSALRTSRQLHTDPLWKLASDSIVNIKGQDRKVPGMAVSFRTVLRHCASLCQRGYGTLCFDSTRLARLSIFLEANLFKRVAIEQNISLTHGATSSWVMTSLVAGAAVIKCAYVCVAGSMIGFP
eukprot:2892556-Amphidinium_carterae.1